MTNRLGFKPCFCLLALLAAPVALTGCASAPISMQAEDNGRLMVAQVELRQQADRLADRLDESGWTVTATPADATRSFFGRLIGGEDAIEDETPDTISAYLAGTGVDGVTADIETLVMETRALADQTLVVASADGNIDARDLERDLAAVERALGAVRRAGGFFEAVSDRDDWSEESADAIDLRLEGFEAVEARLVSAADALAERRWATRSGLFG